MIYTNISRTPDNITFIKEPIAAAYEKLFGAAVERYNTKQKRSDRKIKNGYYEYQFNYKISRNVVTSPDKRKRYLFFFAPFKVILDGRGFFMLGVRQQIC